MKKKLMGLGLTMAIVISLAACGGSGGSTNGSNDVSPAEETSAPEAATAARSTEAAESAASLAFGETGTIGDWNVTVTGSETAKRVDEDMMYFEASEGNQYIMIDTTVENTGKQAASFLSMVTVDGDPNAKLIYGDGYEYKPTGLMGSEKDLQDVSVNPLEKKEGRITFEVPDTVVESDEPITLTITNGTDTLNYTIR